MAVAMKMVHESDPAAQIVKKVGDLTKVRLMANQVLLGVYERPEKTASGLFIPDRTRTEDENQGKVALVLKLGPRAYVDDAEHEFDESEKVKPGEWVSLWVTDGRKVLINDQLCRIVRDFEIRMAIPAPDMVY